MDDFDIYAAGFFDGEGCIQIARMRRKGKHDVYALRVSANQRDARPLLLFAEHYGGKVRKHERTRFGQCDMWRWLVSSAKAEAFLLRVLPYLVVKKDQAELALEFQARRLSHADRLRPEVTAVQRNHDERDRIRMKAMKREAV